MVRKCPYCNQEIKEANPVYCPICGKTLRQPLPKRTGFPIAGGILLIITSCMSILFGILGLNASLQYPRSHSVSLYIGIFGILGFSVGLSGGIASLKRKVFALSILGTCLTLLSGFVNIIIIGSYNQGYTEGILINLPIFVFSIIALILIAVSYKEFS